MLKLKPASQTPSELRFQTRPKFLWLDDLCEILIQKGVVGREARPETSVYYAGLDLTKSEVILELVAVMGGGFLTWQVAPCS